MSFNSGFFKGIDAVFSFGEYSKSFRDYNKKEESDKERLYDVWSSVGKDIVNAEKSLRKETRFE